MRTNKKPIDRLFPKVRKEVLLLLLSNPEKSWYLRDIERRTSCSVSAVRRELLSLVESGAVSKNVEGNRTYYRANTKCQFFNELAGLIRKTAGVSLQIKESLQTLQPKIRFAFLYGSFAKSLLTSSSDIDLMIIGSCTFGQAVEAIHPVQERISREINPSVYSEKEFKKKLEEKNYFITNVMHEPKEFLIGTDLEFRKLASKWLANSSSD